MIQFTCPGCSKAYQVPETAAGKSASCKQCGRTIQVPAAEEVLLDFFDDAQAASGAAASNPAASRPVLSDSSTQPARCLAGSLLDFSIAENRGVIAGDDGNRYMFAGREWKPQTQPLMGMRLNFEIQGGSALRIYPEMPVKRTSGNAQCVGVGAGMRTGTGADTPGLYRSSDDKMLAGVCAGLAHKWNLNLTGVRIATAVGSLFLLVPLVAYIVGAFVLPEIPTKGV